MVCITKPFVQNDPRGVKSTSKMFRALGTINTIQAFDAACTEALERASQRVLELDDKLSVFKPESEIARLNAQAGRTAVSVSADTMALLMAGRAYSAETGGAFSMTTRPLTMLWSLNASCGTVPDRTEIERALLLVNDEDLQLDPKRGTAMLVHQEQAVDLGGIAKGYAADEVKRILMEHGVMNAIANLGGTVFILGDTRVVGIQHPDHCTGISMGRLSLSNQAVVTSGDYERFYEVDGVRYHHILDPNTGYPANSGLRSVTVTGSCAMELDALSTAIFVLGKRDGAALAQKHDMGLVLVTERLDVFCSDSLCGSFSLLAASNTTVLT
ncbi:MAG: FAD:protein FMN transferase [Clostridiaceae bacterium]